MRAISDPKGISEIEEELDAFIIKNSRNPFMLTAFIKKTIESALLEDSIPVVLVFMTDGKIIGVAPLSLRKKFGIRFATLLFDFWFSPDFIFDTRYSEGCMQQSLNFIFDHLGCRLATLDLPAESPNLRILERMCETNRIAYRKKNDARLDHSILPVECTWNDFQKLKSKNVRQKFKKIERQLSCAGKSQVLLFENENNEQDVFRKIMKVEEVSWKQKWRVQHNALVDRDLLNIWAGSSLAIRSCPDFKRSVWFLELNDHAIAYTLVIEYKGTAYVAKTSYKYQYRKLSPGIYINNVMVRDLFNSDRIKTIDFTTNLPFYKYWTSRRLLRVRLFLRKGFLPNLLKLTIRQPQIRRIMWRLIPELVQQLA
jgi:hypothetical protein